MNTQVILSTASPWTTMFTTWSTDSKGTAMLKPGNNAKAYGSRQVVHNLKVENNPSHLWWRSCLRCIINIILSEHRQRMDVYQHICRQEALMLICTCSNDCPWSTHVYIEVWSCFTCERLWKCCLSSIASTYTKWEECPHFLVDWNALLSVCLSSMLFHCERLWKCCLWPMAYCLNVNQARGICFYTFYVFHSDGDISPFFCDKRRLWNIFTEY